MPAKRTWEAEKPADSSTVSNHGDQQQGHKRSCSPAADNACRQEGRVAESLGAAAGEPDGVLPVPDEELVTAAAAAAAATAAAEIAAEAAADAACAGASAPTLTPQQTKVVAKWEGCWEQLGLHHKHGPRCSAPTIPSTTCPQGVVRVVVTALPPRDMREPAALAEWVPRRADRYYIAPDGRHENTLKKLQFSCPYLDWGEEQAAAAAAAAAVPAAAAAEGTGAPAGCVFTRPRQTRRSSTASAPEPPTAAAPGTPAAAAARDTQPDVGGEGRQTASPPPAGAPEHQEQPGSSQAAGPGGMAAGGAGASTAGKGEAVAGAPSGMAAGGHQQGDAIGDLLSVTQHLASASQTLQALVDCAEHLTDGSAHGRVQALQGLLDIHKAALRSTADVVRGQADLFQKLANAFTAIHGELA